MHCVEQILDNAKSFIQLLFSEHLRHCSIGADDKVLNKTDKIGPLMRLTVQ